MMNTDDHDAGGADRTSDGDSGAAASVCRLKYAPEIPIANSSGNATLRTASGAQIEDAGRKMIKHEHGEGGSVNVNFEVAEVTIQWDCVEAS